MGAGTLRFGYLFNGVMSAWGIVTASPTSMARRMRPRRSRRGRQLLMAALSSIPSSARRMPKRWFGICARRGSPPASGSREALAAAAVLTSKEVVVLSPLTTVIVASRPWSARRPPGCGTIRASAVPDRLPDRC